MAAAGKAPGRSRPELLAPAGTVAAFLAAVEAGADAVYVGAPGLNARALARRFSWEEIAAMVDYAHRRGVRLYCAANSLVLEDELDAARRMLHMAAGLEVDAVIVQDMGLARIARREFPSLDVHASTLTCAVDPARVEFFGRQGFSRVVLPRELSLAEIREIAARVPGVELEVFVHGAMCYSYSGLCLFSSYQGGRSGLRGRCVQPCRRRFSWGSGGGYLFSMKDLDASPFVHRLAEAGVASLKIEGRMRSVTYVENVVRAYRMIIDAPDGDRDVMAEAARLVATAMGRPGGCAYLRGERSADRLINWRSSGNTGILAGRAGNRGKRVRVCLAVDLAVGDRLRLHREKSGERSAFTLREMELGGRKAEQARAGEEAVLVLPRAAAAGDSLYLVDRRERKRAAGKELSPGRFRRRVETVARGFSRPRPGKTGRTGKARPAGGRIIPLWVRMSRPDFLREPLPRQVERVVLPLPLSGRVPAPVRFGRGVEVVWSLPVVMDGERRVRAAETVKRMLARGERHFMIAHPGQSAMFTGSGARLYGDYTMNLLNSEAFRFLRDNGIRACLAAVETDGANLARLAAACGPGVGMVVYARVPLFTSRAVDGHLRYGRRFLSPRKEPFELRRFEGMTVALPEEPFSLLDRLAEVAATGAGFGLVDLRFHRPRRNLLASLLAGRAGRRSTFNFARTLA